VITLTLVRKSSRHGSSALELEGLRVRVIHVRWSPPAGGDPKMAA